MPQEADSSLLKTLELYIQQLFSGTATNEQIQKIHQALENFSKQKGAWKNCLYFLNQTSNQQTAMYSLTVLEVSNEHIFCESIKVLSCILNRPFSLQGFITKGWNGFTCDEQLELRTTLYQWLLEKHLVVPYFLRNKVFC